MLHSALFTDDDDDGVVTTLFGVVGTLGVAGDELVSLPLLSNRLRSSSKTECLASKQRTISEGSCDLSSSRLMGRAFRARKRSAAETGELTVAVEEEVLLLIPSFECVERVDHCS